MLSSKRIPSLTMRAQPCTFVCPGTHKSRLFTSSSLPLLNTMAQLRKSSAASTWIASSQSTQTGAPNQPPSMSNHRCSASSSTDDMRYIWAMEQREYSKHAYAKRRINIHPQKVRLPAQNSKYNQLPYSIQVLGTRFSQIYWNQITLVSMWPLRQIFRCNKNTLKWNCSFFQHHMHCRVCLVSIDLTNDILMYIHNLLSKQ